MFEKILLLEKLSQRDPAALVRVVVSHVLFFTRESRGHPRHKPADCSKAHGHPLHKLVVGGGLTP